MNAHPRAEWRLAADWLPVAAVAVVSQAAIGLEQPWAGSDLALAVTSALLALPLAVRRTRPLLTAGLLAAALPTQMALGASLHFGSFVAVLVAAYAAGRHTTTWRRAVLAGAVLLTGTLGSTFRSLVEHVDEVVFPLFYICAAVAVGRVVRRLVQQAAHLREVNAALSRERDTAERLAVATERVRLARELHDGVAHLLTVMVVQAEAGEDSLDRDPAAARRALRLIQSTGRDGLADLRGMVRVLRSEGADRPVPGLADLDTLAAVLGEGGLDVQVTRHLEAHDVDVDLGEQLFRIVQEALTNIVRHSAAATATVVVERGPTGIRLEVRDPGPSLGAETASGGHGIPGMAERVAGFGGSVEAGQLDDGYVVRVTVPDTAARSVDGGLAR